MRNGKIPLDNNKDTKSGQKTPTLAPVVSRGMCVGCTLGPRPWVQLKIQNKDPGARQLLIYAAVLTVGQVALSCPRWKW